MAQDNHRRSRGYSNILDLLDIVSDFFGADKKELKQSLSEVALTSLMLEDKKKLSSATVSKVVSFQILIPSLKFD